MSLYNDLSTVLTPYANKIKQNESDIGDIQDTLEHLDIETDKTLSIDGKPADAKVVGDELSDLKSAISVLSGTYVTPSPDETKAGYYTGAVGNTASYTANANSSSKIFDLSNYVGKKVVVKGTTSNSGSSERIFALCNSSGKISVRHLEKEYTQDGIWFDIDATNYMLYVSYQIYLTSNVTVQVLTDAGWVGMLESDVEDIENSIDGIATTRTDIALTGWQQGFYTGSTGDTIGFTSASNSLAYSFDLSEYIGQYAVVKATTIATQSDRITALCNASGKILSFAKEQAFKTGDLIFYITAENYMLYVSYNIYNTSNVSVTVKDYGQIDKLEQRVNRIESCQSVYVSLSGSDDGDGTLNSPFKTIAHALSVSNRIVLNPGVYDGETIDTDNYDYGEIVIKGQEAKSVIINFGTTFLVNDGSESKVSGYEKVYSVACETFPFATGATKARMYQDYVPDVSTEIPTSDRHPLQRGQQYRCDSTIIKQVASISAIDALPADQYGFFWDSGVMYFSRPQTSSASHPIVIPQRDTTFIKQDVYRKRKQCAIKLNNIEVRYADIRLAYSANHIIADVSVKYPYVSIGGCFYLYNVTNCQLIKCEACSVTSGGAIGDGINVDTDDTAGNETAVSLTARLIDCWSHDNNDDGYSDHDRSEVTVIGGLYEYNGKGGLTPAYGANDIILDAISRYNSGSGILCTGNPSANNGRLKTCVYAEGCVCHGQVNGFYAPESETIIQAVNCTSYDNNVGYSGTSGHIYAVNCKSNDTTAKSGNVTVQDVSDLT